MDDDLLFSDALNRRVAAEVEFANRGVETARLYVMSSSGVIQQRGTYQASVHEDMLAHEFLRQLNKHVAMGGRWVVFWLGTGTDFRMTWLDQDGDAQFTVEIDDDAPGIVETHISHWLQQAYDGWAQWRRSQQALDLRPDQAYKKAQGQQAPSGKKLLVEINHF